ncbi:unnamed protein product, partial [Polarella glacialis]
ARKSEMNVVRKQMDALHADMEAVIGEMTHEAESLYTPAKQPDDLPNNDNNNTNNDNNDNNDNSNNDAPDAGPEAKAKAKPKVAKAKEKPKAAAASRAHLGAHQRIPGRSPHKVAIDPPDWQDSDEEGADDEEKESVESQEMEDEVEAHVDDRDSDSDSEDLPKRVEEENEFEEWRIDRSWQVIQSLLGSLRADDRVQALDTLDAYLASRKAEVKEQYGTLDQIDEDLRSAKQRTDTDFAEVREELDTRDQKTYGLLLRYHKTLDSLMNARDNPALKKRAQALRQQIRSLGGNAPETVIAKPSQMLEIVSCIQDDIRSMRGKVSLEASRLGAYEHA